MISDYLDLKMAPSHTNCATLGKLLGLCDLKVLLCEIAVAAMCLLQHCWKGAVSSWWKAPGLVWLAGMLIEHWLLDLYHPA